MRARFGMLKLLMAAIGSIGLICSGQNAGAQIVINEATMESLATAETDAGPEYRFDIFNWDELDSFGPYTFSEYGTAPGYSSQASAGVEHNSQLASNQLTLVGEVHAYVADDYGYAYCSADSQVASYITFTLTEASRVQVTGSLAFAGYPANEQEAYFSLRQSGQAFLIERTSAGNLEFNQVLPAGTYQLTVQSRVWLEIDFSGGDVYEFSRGSFDLTLAATAVETVPAFLNVRHLVQASSYQDDSPEADQKSSSLFSPFTGDAEANQSSVTAESSLNSFMDPESGVFWAYGYAASGLYVQGIAESDAKSEFRTDFRLQNTGRIELSGVIGVVDFLGGQGSQDTPGFARVLVRVRNLDTNRNVINKVIQMNGNPPVNNQFDLADQFSNVSLQPGRYRLIISAVSADQANNEEVAGSLAVGFLEVEGRIVEDLPQAP